jgi:DNA-binding transcriptional LysR family regulator
MARRYRRVVFHVALGDTISLFDQLRERRIELGFARMSGLDPGEDIDTEMLFDEPMIVVAGEKNPWTRRRTIKLAELVHESWTWPPAGTMFDSLVVEAFRASGLEPPRAAVYTHAINMRIGLAATGHFLAVVPAAILKFPTRHPSIKKLPVELPTTQRQIGIITLKHRTLGPLAQLFIDCAREIAKPLAKTQAPSGRGKNISLRNSQTP